ncbi:MAG: hypothetical protein ACK5L5_06435 [Bacteroidales bacterium]
MRLTSTYNSAHDWTAFGFKVYSDQADNFVDNNSVQGISSDNAPAFLQTIWKENDEDNNREILSAELEPPVNLAEEQEAEDVIFDRTLASGVTFEDLNNSFRTAKGDNQPSHADPKSVQNIHAMTRKKLFATLVLASVLLSFGRRLTP